MDTTDTSDTHNREAPRIGAEEEEKAMTLRLAAALHDRIRIAAAYERKSMAEWIREALEMVVKYNEEERAKESI